MGTIGLRSAICGPSLRHGYTRHLNIHKLAIGLGTVLASLGPAGYAVSVILVVLIFRKRPLLKRMLGQNKEQRMSKFEYTQEDDKGLILTRAENVPLEQRADYVPPKQQAAKPITPSNGNNTSQPASET